MMPQRREKNDKGGHQDAFLGLLTLLESPDPETVDSVKNMIQENLSGSKDSRLLNNLVDFYVATQSKSSFEILLHLKDPHDRHLFEKINEMMKPESARYNALQLLGNIVYKQPTWLYKIAGQRVMHTLLEILKTDQNCPNLLSGLFILICLLPTIPNLFGSLLRETFDIFSRLAAWNVKRPSSISDILNLHLQTGIYSLFHRLYGMFPCNFLAYLRSFYGGRDNSGDNAKVFSLVIKPMLERVRLHPLLVTASKETELNVNRWKRMAYHDIIVDCASISLDTIEGTLENYKKMDSSTSSHSEKVSSYESANSVNFCQNNAPIFMDLEYTMTDSALSNLDDVWSPYAGAAVSYSSSLASPTTTKGEWEFKNVMQSSTEESIPLDFAVEAKPELLKSEISEQTSKGKPMFSHNSIESDIATSTAMKKSLINDFKEDDTDKEVSELTSADLLEQSLTAVDVRHDTPFCSTTQTLTDEPANLIRYESLTRNDDEEEVDEMYNSMQEPDLQPYVSSLTRYRYFSHCGPPPDLECILKKPKVFRSISCPPVLNSEQSLVLTESSDDKNAKESEIASCSSNIIPSTTASAFVPLNGEKSLISKNILPVYQQLLPSILNPLQGFEQSIIIGLSNAQKQNPKILSPPELLDQYIQQSGTAYLSHLPLTSTTNTDWTHFGGKPPPEEMEILRNQILLLHNMLLFERHRKDIHSERNRRILGRAKRNKMHEENVNALKTEIVILTEENTNLEKELSNQYKMYQNLQDQKRLMKEDFDSKLFKSCQDNTQLLFSNKQMQTLLVSQKEENDEIRELYKEAQCDVAASRCQLKYAKQEMQHCQKVKKEAIFLTKQLIMLQELNSQYKSKLEHIKKPQLNIETELLNDSMVAEIKDLKLKLENKSITLDSAKRKISELENILSDMKLKQKEKASMYETMKTFHQAEIMAREDRLGDLRKISLEKDSHILKLYSDLDRLKEEITSLERKMQQNVNDKCSNNGLQTLSSTGCDKSFVEKEDGALS